MPVYRDRDRHLVYFDTRSKNFSAKSGRSNARAFFLPPAASLSAFSIVLMVEGAVTTINSSLCYDPLVNLLCTETEGDLQFAAGYALGFDLFRDNKDVLEALFEICASRGLAERLLLSLMKYYVAKLQDINLLLRDNDCITYLWKLYLNHQTSFLIDTALRKTLNQVRWGSNSM